MKNLGGTRLMTIATTKKAHDILKNSSLSETTYAYDKSGNITEINKDNSQQRLNMMG